MFGLSLGHFKSVLELIDSISSIRSWELSCECIVVDFISCEAGKKYKNVIVILYFLSKSKTNSTFSYTATHTII